jgi:hemerythrin-like domain-containing protein
MTIQTTQMRLSSTSPDLPPALYGYAAMHLGMQRDADRLTRTLAGTPSDLATLQRWWTAFRDVIVRHHTREDDLIWPALAAADPTFADDVAAMHDDHDELDAAMDRLDAALATVREQPDEARLAAEVFGRVLADHLVKEEAAAFNRLAQRPQLWAEIERRIDEQVRLRETSFELPWVLDSLPTSLAAHVMQRVPRPARPIARRWMQPRYHRFVTAAHTTERTS